MVRRIRALAARGLRNAVLPALLVSAGTARAAPRAETAAEADAPAEGWGPGPPERPAEAIAESWHTEGAEAGEEQHGELSKEAADRVVSLADARDRAALLAPHLSRYTGDPFPTRPVAGALLALGAGGGALMLLSTELEPAPRALWGAGFGLLAAAGATAFLVPEPYVSNAFRFAADAGVSAIWAGFAFSELPVTHAALSAGYGAAALLSATNLLLSDPPPAGKLSRHYAAVATPEGRAALSPEQVRRIEDDFRRTRRALPPWVVSAPLVLGGTAAMLPALDRSIEGSERTRILVLGGVQTLVGAARMLMAEPYDAYERDAEAAGLKVRLTSGPGLGIGLAGQF